LPEQAQLPSAVRELSATEDLARLLTAGTLNYGDLKDCDIVVEAVFENMKVKTSIFGQLDKVCKPGCILASNTSSVTHTCNTPPRGGAPSGLFEFATNAILVILVA
jgi:3-hydroxyacyl-CoA dehydrogenase